jgi:DNA polymerase II large subunit
MKEITKDELLSVLKGVDVTYLKVAKRKGNAYTMDTYSKERVIREVGERDNICINEFKDRERPLGFDYEIPNWYKNNSFLINTHS